ncbi:uncharacterized protein LOC124933585 [Impatiens glandulifera]|uniref:uncharacterized protein LOC124933585 n=1 Tax=Impatiens glandulifera TaxID=253017 RepID=UPI001FB14653|nr:uncharacterized protein LOC124933585 [Impatiens glandulifera]
MESYLVGEDLWDNVVDDDDVAHKDVAKNAETSKKRKRLNTKAEFVLKRSISHNLFEHIIGCGSAREIWETLYRLFNKKNEARLQILENELAAAKQIGSVSDFFLKVKNICSKVSLLNPNEKISEARTKRHIVRGLRPEYTPFITSIQGWSQQPSLEEFENLLSSQESLAAQITRTSIKEESNSALLVKKSSWKNGKSKKEETCQDSSNIPKKSLKCFRCGKTRHFKRDCRVNLNGNFVSSNLGEKSNQRVEED